MKIINNLTIFSLIIISIVTLQSCDNDDFKMAWDTRHLDGSWIMTEQEFSYYDEYGKVTDKEKHSYSYHPRLNKEQLKLDISRESSDEFYFETYHASHYDWAYDSEYFVYVNSDFDLFRLSNKPTHGHDEYIGHIQSLSATRLVLTYEESSDNDSPSYKVRTTYKRN
ncbi:MAG: hypothetical protein HUJ96_00265 [Marinilabiliaceae bacterium]|nr:hypothetical protein [Marinilabiliaceae bacterium]